MEGEFSFPATPFTRLYFHRFAVASLANSLPVNRAFPYDREYKYEYAYEGRSGNSRNFSK
jgi:hypothetical protein